MTRHISLAILLVALATGLAACGGSGHAKPAPGSAQNPLVGHDPEVASSQLGGVNEGTEPSNGGGAKQAHHKASGHGSGAGAKHSGSGSGSKSGSGSGSGTGSASSNTGSSTPGEPSTANPPGYGTLLTRQSRHPDHRFSPCNLVTESQAQSIMGAPVQQPLEAPQGPTCIYRTRTGKGFVSVVVQTADYHGLSRLVRKSQSVSVGGHSGVCGKVGQPTLFLPLTRGRVLTIAGSCDVAKRFAVEAVQHL